VKLKSLVAPVAAACAAAALTGCYVVPVDQNGNTTYTSPVWAVPAPAPARATASAPVPMAAPAPVPTTTQVRLYPANDIAMKTGPLSAVVIDNAQGHGTFQLHFAGEYMQGEATRLGAGRQGVANASSAKGTYVKCDYALNASNRGTGNCAFSNGARYQLHFGS
jgi:hypothetical protein